MSNTSGSNGSTATVTGAAASVARQALTSLPAQFLVLCLINAVFVLGLLWFLEARTASAERIMQAIITGCMVDEHHKATN